MSSDHGSRLRDLIAVLHEIGVMSMTAQSDPHNSAKQYRKDLIAICNRALKAQDDAAALLRASVSALPETLELSRADQEQLIEAILNPPEPTEALKQAMKRWSASALSPDPSALREAANPPANQQENQNGNESDGYVFTEGGGERTDLRAQGTGHAGAWNRAIVGDGRGGSRMQSSEGHRSAQSGRQDGAVADAEVSRLAAALASPRETEPAWQPMETMPEDGQVIVCWQTDTFDTIGRREYLEILEYGEEPAKGWMPLPSPPLPKGQPA